MQQWYHAMTILKHTGTKMVVKMDGWREAEREREKFMPSHDDSSNTEQVNLFGHIASEQFCRILKLYFSFSQVHLRF